jgi:DDE_Tnp_1-associated/Transposase DDE domain
MSVPLSLLEVLAEVPDPRNPKGVRYPLPAVLALAVLAMLTGAKSYCAIAQFGRDKGGALALALGFRRGMTLCKSALADLFARLDAAAFEAALSRWVASRLPPGQQLHLCIDGKTARGSRDGDAPGHHLLAAYAPAAQAVLAQLRVDAKTNEHKAALQLLGILPIKGCIFTGDALFCQRDVCEKIIEGEGDYVFVVKDNQPSLATDIGAGLAFEAEKRRQAAAFFPLPGGSAVAGERGADVGQGARPVGGQDAAADERLDEGPGLGGVEAGLRVDARADGEGQKDGGSGAWDNQPRPGAGGRGAAVGTDPGALGNRERAALSARRDDGGGCQPGA